MRAKGLAVNETRRVPFTRTVTREPGVAYKTRARSSAVSPYQIVSPARMPARAAAEPLSTPVTWTTPAFRGGTRKCSPNSSRSGNVNW